MRNLISGVVGVAFGGFILMNGRPRGEGAYYQGQVVGWLVGLLLFVGGLYYFYKAFRELKGGPKKRKGRKKAGSGSSRSRPGGDL